MALGVRSDDVTSWTREAHPLPVEVSFRFPGEQAGIRGNGQMGIPHHSRRSPHNKA